MASELNLSNVGGVFVVLIGGMGLALVVAIFEFLGECRDISKDESVRYKCFKKCIKIESLVLYIDRAKTKSAVSFVIEI